MLCPQDIFIFTRDSQLNMSLIHQIHLVTLSRNKLGDFIDRHAPDLVIQQDLSLKLEEASRSDTTTYTFKAKFKDGTEVTSNTLLQVRCECLILEIEFV